MRRTPDAGGLRAGVDYVAAVAVRCALLLAAGTIARFWLLPRSWESTLDTAVLAYVVLVVHAMPAAAFARRQPRPWWGWTMLHAAAAHAITAAASYPMLYLLEPRFQPAPHLPGSRSGMSYPNPFFHEPGVLEIGGWIAVYAAASALFAVMVGWEARRMRGVEPHDAHLVRLRGRRARPMRGGGAGTPAS
jgi:hypothetical protein